MRKTALPQANRARKIRFERLVVRALRRLPPEVRDMLDNVEIVVEDEPTAEQLASNEDGDELFGLYEGTPLTARGSGYSMVLPDKITIFRRPIERACPTPEEMADEIRITVIHELAHHFGIEEDRIAALGWA
jgi:predicted Zn-dependent protease with MMP-like domain